MLINGLKIFNRKVGNHQECSDKRRGRTGWVQGANGVCPAWRPSQVRWELRNIWLFKIEVPKKCIPYETDESLTAWSSQVGTKRLFLVVVKDKIAHFFALPSRWELRHFWRKKFTVKKDSRFKNLSSDANCAYSLIPSLSVGPIKSAC